MFKFKPIDVSKIPVKNLLIVCLCIVSLASMKECSNKSLELESNQGNWKFKYALMVDSFSTTVNDQGQQLAYQDQLLVSEKQSKELLAMENSALKKLNSSTKTKTVTVIKEVPVPLGDVVEAKISVDTVTGDTTEVTRSYKPFDLSTEWYSLSGKVFDKELTIDSMFIRNVLTTNIGWKKDKWYKKKYAVVEVKNDNPYTSVTGMQNVVVKPPKKKFFQTTGFKIGVGVLGGFYLSKKL